MSNLYKQNQAFERAYEIAKNIDSDKNDINGLLRTRHYSYASNSEKLRKISSSAVLYLYWFDELYQSSQKLIDSLNRICKSMESLKTTWLGLFTKKRKINNYFDEMYTLSNDLSEFKNECYEFQRCIIATEIHQNTDMAILLQEQLRYLDLLESRIAQTGDRKLSSINNSRMQLFGLVLSIAAIVVSVVSLFYSQL